MKANKSGTLRLYLIRHGETGWSRSGRHTGRTDIPLTPNGEDEARELGKHLRDISFAQVLTSPLRRAVQTCSLAGLYKNPEIEPDLAEWDYGDYEGQRSVDIRKQRPGWNVYRDVKCPHRYPLALIDSSPACTSWTEISLSLHTASSAVSWLHAGSDWR